MKRILIGLAALIVVLAALGYAFLIAPKHTPEHCAFTIDLPKLRALAGTGPKEIRVEGITSAQFPIAVASVGQPWDKVEFRVYSYQLVYADKTIIIDTAMNQAQAKDLGMTDDYDEAAWQRLVRAMGKASAIYVTHEHADHMGGAVTAVFPGLRLTDVQLNGGAPNTPEISAAVRAATKTITYAELEAVAPGVVLIKAPGHTPGSQMVYINRADGQEVILTGDTAWIMKNIETEQGPVRLASLMMKGDRNANACQLVALHQVEKDVSIMPGHDKARMTALLAKGVFIRGFVE